MSKVSSQLIKWIRRNMSDFTRTDIAKTISLCPSDKNRTRES